MGYSVYLTHLPSRDPVPDADAGARKEAVLLTGADGAFLDRALR